jgi:hypothetical protein
VAGVPVDLVHHRFVGDEDKIEIPDAWYDVLHPRRHGLISRADRPGSLGRPTAGGAAAGGAAAQAAAWGAGLTADQERVLGEEYSQVDPALVELVRSGDPGVAADAIRLALALNPVRDGTVWDLLVQPPAEPLEQLVASRGLAHAALAFVASRRYDLAYGLVPPGRLALTIKWREEAGDAWRPSWWDSAARHLRAMLAAVPQPEYDGAIAALTSVRAGGPHERIATSYLVPDRHDWVQVDVAELRASHPHASELLFYSVATAAELAGFPASGLAQFVTAYDAIGVEAVPLIARWLAEGWSSLDVRRDALDVLSRIPADAAFGALLNMVDDVPWAVLTAAARFPRRAARMLAARRDEDFIEVLFRRHVTSYPDVAEAALVVRAPEAPAERVPGLLASPPWTRKPPAKVKVAPSPLAAEPRMAWRDGERDEWAYDWREFTSADMRKHLPLADRGEAPAEFYTLGPADLVRPRLFKWKAESTWFYLQDPRVIVGKYELDALGPMLRLARRKPAVAATALMPYLGQEVADLMAEWLVRSRLFRPVAQDWFTRHGAAAIALVIPAALSGPPDQSLALFRLEPGEVLAAADQLGCRPAVAALLDRDPLDLIPAKVPAVPRWADPELLPPVLLADRRDALPADAVGALLRMIAISQLDQPYQGLRVVAGQCDPGSLSGFAWSLYRLWEAEERPAKDAWAMNALGYFGDDTVADRLAPLVRAWPSEGAAQRAKRGADILAAMGSERALGHLSGLARNAKSAPLRAHAAEALDRVAGARGLLPEQLDDLLAPDLGLDGEPVSSRGVSYQVDLGDGELVLRDRSGQRLTKLPGPADEDTSSWNSRRRTAKPAIADQTARLEEAMITQRRWSHAEFLPRIAAHPLLGRLARRLVWALDDRTASIDRLGDLVDPAGGLIGDGNWVRLAHPAVDDFTPWRLWGARLASPQPFAQADRDVFPGEDPSAYWQHTVEATALHRLLRYGWQWGPAGRQATRHQLFRPFGAEGRVVLTLDPGVSAVSDAKQEPRQTLAGLAFESSAGELGVFSDLPPVTRSELIRSLRTLG